MSLSALHHALLEKDVDKVLAISARRPHVPLRYVARIVCLMAATNDKRYDPAASRFLVRVIDEIEPTLTQVVKLADCLYSARHGHLRHEARMGLQDVVGQLHRMHRKSSDWLEVPDLGPDPPPPVGRPGRR